MRKKIPTHQLRLGMHLHALCGAWIDHPFWRSRFVLEHDNELRAVKACGVSHCWIDTARGLDVLHMAEPALAAAAAEASAVIAAAAASAAPMPPIPPPAAVSTLAARTPLAEDLKRAASICRQAKPAVQKMFGQARLGLAVDAAACLPLVEEISNSVLRNSGALIGLARLKTHDDYSYMHSVAVCALMVALARQLGLGEAETREAGLAGLLHDIGKALMPADLLNKPGPLTEPEFALMRGHAERGRDLLARSGTVGEVALDVCLHHHERIDGSGYPDRLAGERISLPARMGAVCDVYDAITSERPYKAAWGPSEAIARMAEWRRGQFDGGVFQAFVKALGIYPAGSLVRLQSGRLAVVVEQNPEALTAPRVKAFFSTRSQLHVTPETIDLSRPSCSDRIAGRESNAVWKFSHLDELWAGPEALKQLGR